METPDGRVTIDDVLDLETSGRDHAEIAETLVQWSSLNEGEDEPEGQLPASLLITAAEHLDMGGLDGAGELLDRAESAVGHEQIDFFQNRISHALRKGDLGAALAIEEAARKVPINRYQTYEMMADLLDSYGETQRGLRWANIGLRRMEQDPDADFAYEHLLLARYHLRRRHGMKLDNYDKDAEDILALDD